MRKATYRVLIMDEKQEVLERIANEITKNNSHWVNNVKYSIELSILQIECEKDTHTQKWVISSSTLNKLATYIKTPFDLILTDYGFIADQEAMKALDEKIKTGHKVVESDFKDFLLFPMDIKRRFEDLKNSGNVGAVISGIDNWFLGHEAPVYIYTYTDANFEQFLPINSSGDIESNLKDVFPNSRKIKYILTWSELFNRHEFENINATNKNYYPFIVAKYLNLLIVKELLKKVAYEQRFLAFKNYRVAIFWLIAIGVTIGTFSEWLGKMAVKLYYELWHPVSQPAQNSMSQNNKWIAFIAFIILMIGIIAGIAIFLWFITERIMKKLIGIKLDKE